MEDQKPNEKDQPEKLTKSELIEKVLELERRIVQLEQQTTPGNEGIKKIVCKHQLSELE